MSRRTLSSRRCGRAAPWWLLLTWAGVTLLADRTFGLSTPRPPGPTMRYGIEPVRDARGALDGWADSDADAATPSR